MNKYFLLNLFVVSAPVGSAVKFAESVAKEIPTSISGLSMPSHTRTLYHFKDRTKFSLCVAKEIYSNRRVYNHLHAIVLKTIQNIRIHL